MKRLSAFLLMLILLFPGLAAAETVTRVNEETAYRAVIEDTGGLLDAAEFDGVFGVQSLDVGEVEVGILLKMRRDAFNDLRFEFFFHDLIAFYSALPLMNALTSILRAGLMVVQMVAPFM